MKRSLQNRQLPVAKKYEDQIFNEVVKAREKILGRRCGQIALGQKCPHHTATTGTTIHVTTYTSNQRNALGAWAILAPRRGGHNTAIGYDRSTTQFRLQLESLVAALKICGDLPGPLVLKTTARSIAESLNSGQAAKWQRAGWKKANGDPIAYPKIWAELLRLVNDTAAYVKWTPTNDPAMVPLGKMLKRLVTNS